MTEIYRFHRRGHQEVADDKCYLIESDAGTILTIIEVHGNAEFVVGYCRKAVADRWGVYCYDLFRRVSDLGLTRSWAEEYPDGMHLFRGVRFHLAREEEWMLRSQ